jgi:predicted SnoaL-like aldol condensation-catalyzing enzyme
MDLIDFLQRYTDEVYLARDPDAAARFIADPCLRHEQGHLVTMSLADNIARIRGFLDSAPDIAFANRVVVADDERLVSCYDITIGTGDTAQVVSGIEVFRVVDGLITETWNTAAQPGAWG